MTSEAFSRFLIDKALEASGWDLEKQVCFELATSTGRADYVLNEQYGPLCVLEAKREQVDPYDAKGFSGYAGDAFRLYSKLRRSDVWSRFAGKDN